MSYNDQRAYIDGTFGNQNVIATASTQVVTNSNVIYLPVNEASFVCSICAVANASPSNAPSTVKYAVLTGTTTIGSVSPAQTAGSVAFTTISPPVAVGSGSALTISIIATGTASATETAAGVNIQCGLAPQFV